MSTRLNSLSIVAARAKTAGCTAPSAQIRSFTGIHSANNRPAQPLQGQKAVEDTSPRSIPPAPRSAAPVGPAGHIQAHQWRANVHVEPTPGTSHAHQTHHHPCSRVLLNRSLRGVAEEPDTSAAEPSLKDLIGLIKISRAQSQAALRNYEWMETTQNKALLTGWWNLWLKTLDRDLVETPDTGVATIMADEHFNVWDKTGPGMTNYVP